MNLNEISQDHSFDSVSMCSSQSTVCDSDIAEMALKSHENIKTSINPVGLHNNQINLSIQVINNNSNSISLESFQISA
jgi:phage regulator Rha-like protein